jgi:hypothetical protein
MIKSSCRTEASHKGVRVAGQKPAIRELDIEEVI